MSEPPALPSDVVAAARRAAMPDFTRWREMVGATGGCAEPVRLQGDRMTVDTRTGEVLEEYRTKDEPTGYLLTACGNRRASRCPACSAIYRDDTYHLIIAGLRGGKGVPEDVSGHPRVFATFTAPSFGAVHARRGKGGKPLPCRPRRDGPVCPHGRPEGCRKRHQEGDRQIGQPLCVDCYDYAGAVLWNAHAGELWRRFTHALPAVLAQDLGVTRKELRAVVRVSFAKVAEYQARGLVHFHTVIRLDGPDGPTDRPPDWVTVALLDRAVRAAAGQVTVPVPSLVNVEGPSGRSADRLSDRSGTVLEWGSQLDVQPVYVATELEGMTDQKVAAYVAKYATKGAETAGTVDRPIRQPWEIARLEVTEHARRMIWTCFTLAELPEYRDIPLRRWAHMLGYRGHFSTKSRRYSTTLTALRQTRADHRAEQTGQSVGRDAEDGSTVTLKEWRFAGSGHRHGEHFWAEQTRQRIETARKLERENRR